MTEPVSSLYASEIIACVADGREPTFEEMIVVAARIWTDGAHDRSIMAWSKLPVQSDERRIALRAAAMALRGGIPRIVKS